MIMLSDLFSTLRGGAARVALKTSIAIGTALCAAGPLALPAHAAPGGGPIVATTQGKMQGFVVNGVSEFLGIPYARPPIGNLRWRPPVAHPSWGGVKQTTAYGPVCAQIYLDAVYAGPANSNEDCLYLNVFTPLAQVGQNLPVIFWIHGGGNDDGETPGYDGSKLAAQGHTVVVSVEYRLNLFGFLALPSLDSEGHLFGNYGILDQQFALQWVHNNIANFGGNPNNVTVAGQSAGAQDTTINIVSPLAKGLFQHGICESLCTVNVTPLSRALSDGAGFAVAAGCGALTGAAQAACLRAVPAAKIQALAGNGIPYTFNGQTQNTGNSAYVAGAMVDGTIIPIQPIVAWHTGAFNMPMTLMNGAVADEENFQLAKVEWYESPRVPFTGAQYEAAINTTYSAPNALPPGLPYPAGTAAAILAHYPLSAYPSAQLAWNQALTDPSHCVNAHIDGLAAARIPVYGYSFDDRTAPFIFPPMPGFIAGAYHTSDQQYLFPGWSGYIGIAHPLTRLQGILSDELVAAWTNYANTGNPNGVGNTPWPTYLPGRHILSENSPALSTYTYPAYQQLHMCTFWATIFPYTYGPAY